MVKPNDILEQDKLTDFVADEKIFFAIGNKKYDKAFYV